MITTETHNVTDYFFEIPVDMKKVALHLVLDNDEILMTHYNLDKNPGTGTHILRIQNRTNSLGSRTVIL